MKSFLTASAAAMLLVGAAHAQTGQGERDIGRAEFEENCASCHGADGRGNGPMAAFLTTGVPDLTQIQKTNNGVFPFARLYEVIEGSEQAWVEAHGARDMPVWGREYSREAKSVLGEYQRPMDVQSFTRGRILALLGYVHSLQGQ